MSGVKVAVDPDMSIADHRLRTANLDICFLIGIAYIELLKNYYCSLVSQFAYKIKINGNNFIRSFL